jgi:hypothetical protein
MGRLLKVSSAILVRCSSLYVGRHERYARHLPYYEISLHCDTYIKSYQQMRQSGRKMIRQRGAGHVV